MTTPSRFLALAGALMLGVAVTVVRWSGPAEADGDRDEVSPAAVTTEAGPTVPPREQPAAVGAVDAPPLPAAIAAAAAENCDTPAKVEPEAAPIAKFLDAPCGPGDSTKTPDVTARTP